MIWLRARHKALWVYPGNPGYTLPGYTQKSWVYPGGRRGRSRKCVKTQGFWQLGFGPTRLLGFLYSIANSAILHSQLGYCSASLWNLDGNCIFLQSHLLSVALGGRVPPNSGRPATPLSPTRVMPTRRLHTYIHTYIGKTAPG